MLMELNFADNQSGSEALHPQLLHFDDYIKYLVCKASGPVIAWLNSVLPLFFLSPSLYSDLSENQIQGIPRKAFRGAVEIKNL